ncbi:MAG TPA: hypothetical protein VFA26_21780, partial [Gemmataceae bacterium]|nr:hypothetical protein [Gemmataceae bacterium]
MSIWTRWLKLTPSASRTARRRSRKPSSQRRTGKVKVEQLEDRTLLSAAVWTNQSDYAPGSTAIIQGSGFQVGEAIRLEVLRSDGTPQGGSDNPWTITDGGQGDLDGVADGKFTTSWYVDPTYATNQTLNVTATGLTSGEAASATFTDAAVTISLTGGDVGSSTSDGVTSHNGSSAALSLTFSGTCQGGNRTIQLIEGTTVIASTSTSGGNWSITLNSPGTTLSDGVHNLVAHQTNGSFTDSTPLVVTIDTVAPTISGAATTSPNGAGWYTGDVTVHWTVSDALSGIAAPPADSTITGEGSNLSASAT